MGTELNFVFGRVLSAKLPHLRKSSQKRAMLVSQPPPLMVSTGCCAKGSAITTPLPIVTESQDDPQLISHACCGNS